jgi:phosphatidylglycerophosphatase A
MTIPAVESDRAAGGASERLALLLATAGGLGYSPVAPGTAGSLAAVALFAAAQTVLDPALFLFAYSGGAVALAAIAFWSAARAMPRWQSKDPQAIVIDEVAGQWLAYGGWALGAAAGLAGAAGAARWKSLLAGFILFRLFDVLKPFPVRAAERVPGAAGIVLDDVVAGLYAALALLALQWTGWLG